MATLKGGKGTITAGKPKSKKPGKPTIETTGGFKAPPGKGNAARGAGKDMQELIRERLEIIAGRKGKRADWGAGKPARPGLPRPVGGFLKPKKLAKGGTVKAKK